jgi:hypothetical protein
MVVLMPPPLKFSRTPGNNLTLRRNRKPIGPPDAMRQARTYGN